MKIAVIGAGLTGMSCARLLSEHSKVVLFEKEDVGGLASSYCTGRYCIEKFYHHCFRSDDVLIDLVRKLGLRIVWKVVRIGYAFDGRVYPLNTPVEILKYPHLSFRDKVRLALFTLKSRRRDYSKEDGRSVVEGIREELGENVLNKFFMPLLKAKFGEEFEKVSYAWLLARVAIRSNRKLNGEELGYVRHGFHELVERLAEGLDIRKEEVRKIEKVGGKFDVNGERFDVVVYTAPIPTLDDRIRKVAGIPDIKYQSSVCALIGTKESITEDIYWTNVADSRVFGAIIEHTHFMPFEDYGEHIIYLASYSKSLFNKNIDELKRVYLKEARRFGLNESSVNWIEIFKAKYSGPVYEVGYLKKITPYRTKIRGFYIAGMTSPPNYPERSMNGSVKAGFEVAEAVKKDFEL